LKSTTTIESIIKDDIECRIGNKTTKATYIDSTTLECDLTVNNKEEILTIWYSKNQTFLLSSNSIKLMYFGKKILFSLNLF